MPSDWQPKYTTGQFANRTDGLWSWLGPHVRMVPSIRAQRLVRPGATPVVSILIGLVAAVAFLSLDAPDAVWHPQPDAGFSPTDPLTVQQVWPSVGTTVGPAATAARVQAAALGAVGLEQVADPVWIVSLISVVLASIITRAVGGSVLAAAGAALALAFGGVFSTRAAAAHPVMFGAFFALATIAAARYWVDSRRGRALALCAATYAAAVAVHPS
ncbi:MAG TPA: hypothetical protein VF424_08910, partial [Vicinamibacterales bacterium]